jgi:hypothetical protein
MRGQIGRHFSDYTPQISFISKLYIIVSVLMNPGVYAVTRRENFIVLSNPE